MRNPISTATEQEPISRFISDRSVCVVGSALIIALALAVHVWADLQWTVNFDGDGAIIGLMARHILQGQIPTYFYGQQYVGSLEALISAGFMYLFGPNAFVLRMSSLLLFALFLVLHASFVYRQWGTRVTLISLLVLALPGWKMLEATFRPFGGYGTLLVFGTAILLLSRLTVIEQIDRIAGHQGKSVPVPTPQADTAIRPLRDRPILLVKNNQPQGQWANYFLFILIGTAAGLGLWSQPMMVIYLASVVLVLWLQTPEWAAIHQRIGMTSLRLFHVTGSMLLTALMLGLLGIVIVGFFSAGWSQSEVFSTLQSAARWLLVLVVAGFVLLTARVSTRRRHILAWAACISAGLAFGSLPVWTTWLFSGVAPSIAIIPSSPTETLFRLRLTVIDLLPAMLGIPALTDIFRPPALQTVLWLFILSLALTAFGVFIWKERQVLQSLISLTPLARSANPAALVGLLFGVSLVLVLLGGNTLDTDSVRYLLIAWQASSIVLAIFFSRSIARFRALGLLLVGLWVFQVGIGNVVDVGQQWNALREGNVISATGVEFHPLTRESVSNLESFLKEHHVQGGYADYWVAYQLDFLSEERMTIAPYNGGDRYPAYSGKVTALPVQAFILRPGLAPAGPSQTEDLARQITASSDGGFAFGHVAARLEKMTVLVRQRVANWDVWLLVDNNSLNY